VDFTLPRFLQVSKVLPHGIVPVIDGAANRRKGRVELDLRIVERDECFKVVRVIRLCGAASELDVLLRHTLSLVRVSE
jgi:hypothetical protein